VNVVLVGASSSIGRATERAFEAGGHRVTGTSSLDLDLTSDRSIADFASRQQDVDALLVLSGVLPGKSLGEYDRAAIDHVMSVNVVGPALLVQAIAPRLRDGALVLLMSSVSAERGSFDPIYAASKAALSGLARSLAVQLAPRVRVNAVAPALVEGSAMAEAMPPARRALHAERALVKRLMTVDEVGGLLTQLCSPAWASVSGQVIRVDGGSAFI